MTRETTTMEVPVAIAERVQALIDGYDRQENLVALVLYSLYG